MDLWGIQGMVQWSRTGETVKQVGPGQTEVLSASPTELWCRRRSQKLQKLERRFLLYLLRKITKFSLQRKDKAANTTLDWTLPTGLTTTTKPRCLSGQTTLGRWTSTWNWCPTPTAPWCPSTSPQLQQPGQNTWPQHLNRPVWSNIESTQKTLWDKDILKRDQAWWNIQTVRLCLSSPKMW